MWNLQPKVFSESVFDQRESQVAEASRIFGKPCRYMKPNSVLENEIFGEVLSRDFLEDNSYLYYLTRDDDSSFMGNGESFSGFGFVPSYSDIVYIPVKFFNDDNIEPIEGDLIYYEIEKTLFEVTKVGTLTEAYNGDRINDRLFNYKLYLKLYSLADDEFEGFNITEAPELDDLDDVTLNNLNDSLTATLELENPITANSSNPFGEL